MAKSKNKILKDNAKYFLETQVKKEKRWEKTPTREEVRDAGIKKDLASRPVVVSSEGDELVSVKKIYEKNTTKELLKDALVKK